MGEAWARILSEGGILAALVVIYFIVKALVPLFNKKDGNGAHKSAGLTAAEWKGEIRLAVKEVLLETAPHRHQELERLFERVFNHKFMERDRELRKIIHDELERWEKE